MLELGESYTFYIYRYVRANSSSLEPPFFHPIRDYVTPFVETYYEKKDRVTRRGQTGERGTKSRLPGPRVNTDGTGHIGATLPHINTENTRIKSLHSTEKGLLDVAWLRSQHGRESNDRGYRESIARQRNGVKVLLAEKELL